MTSRITTRYLEGIKDSRVCRTAYLFSFANIGATHVIICEDCVRVPVNKDSHLVTFYQAIRAIAAAFMGFRHNHINAEISLILDCWVGSNSICSILIGGILYIVVH